MLVKRYLLMICFFCAALLSACANSLQSIDDPVTIAQSNVTWETYQYELTDFNTIFPGSYDGKTRTQHTFETWVLENEFLRVTLLPEFGGRILSILYKPTDMRSSIRIQWVCLTRLIPTFSITIG